MSDEGKPVVHPSLRCIIAQYDSDEEREREQEGVETKTEPPEEMTQSQLPPGEEGDEPMDNEGAGDEDQEEDNDESGAAMMDQDEGARARCDVPELGNRQGRMRRDNSFNSFNMFEYSGQMPSPPTEVSSSESDEEYVPNGVPKAKASPAKSPRKETEIKVEPKDEVETAPDGRVECSVCGHSYSNFYNLTRHRRNGNCKRNLSNPQLSNNQKPKSVTPNSSDKRRKASVPKSQHVKTETGAVGVLSNANQPHVKCCLCKEHFSQEGIKRHFAKSHPDEDTEEMLERSVKDSASFTTRSSRSPPRKRLRCRSKVKYQDSSDSEGNSMDEMAYFELDQEKGLHHSASSSVNMNRSVSPDIVTLRPQEPHAQVTDEVCVPIKMERETTPPLGKKETSMTRSNSDDGGVNNSNSINGNGECDRTGPKQYKCEFCRKLFRDKYALNVHRRVHTGEKPYECPICNARFTRKYHLLLHLRKHHQQGPDREKAMELISSFKTKTRFTCIECGQQFNRSNNLASHIKAQHTRLDGWQHSSTMDLIQNTNQPDIMQPYSSLSLEQEDYSDIIDYMRFSDDEIGSSIHLDICNRGQFNNSTIFRPPHNLEDDYEDDVMPLILPYMRQLQGEKKRLPTKTKIKPEVDEEESEEGRDNTKVNIEMDDQLLSYFLDSSIPVTTSHSANMESGSVQPEQAYEKVLRPFQCRYCRKRFIKEFKLNIHMRTHEKPFHCSVCKRRFSTRQNLKNHMNTHTGEKPHRCTDCGLGFYSASVLWTHKAKMNACDFQVQE